MTELRDALGSDAYWKAPTWKRLVAIGAGPAAEHRAHDRPLHIPVHDRRRAGDANSCDRGARTPARHPVARGVGRPPGRRPHRRDRRHACASGRDRARLSATRLARSSPSTIVRNGKELQLGPVAAQLVDDRYRLGFGLDGKGLGLLCRYGPAVRVTGLVSKEIVKSLGRLVTGQRARRGVEPDRDHACVVRRGRARRRQLSLGPRSHLALARAAQPAPAAAARRRPHPLHRSSRARAARFLRREIHERVSMVGLALVLLLFFVGLSNDIGKLS